MKRMTILLSFLLLTAGWAGGRQRDLAVGPPAAANPALSSIYDHSWALLIGIDDYQFAPKLHYAVADAEAVKDYLLKGGGFPADHVFTLENDQATKVNLETWLGTNLPKKLGIGPNDRVLIFFAGHGQTDELPNGGQMGYLVPVDGRTDNLYGTCLSMSQLRETSRMIPSKHVFYIVDACYSGIAGIETRGLPPADSARYLQKLASQRAIQILTAGQGNETVIEGPQFGGGHSVFTSTLLSGLQNGNADLNGDGIVPASELYAYLAARVTRDSDGHQTPKLFTMDGDGEFVFFAPGSLPPRATAIGPRPSPAPASAALTPPISPLPPSLLPANPIPGPAEKDRAACLGGDLAACVQLGECYEKGGAGVLRDPERAGRIYQAACDKGNPRGCRDLALCYVSGGCGLAKDPVQSGKFMQKACEGGDQEGCYDLGRCYQYAFCGFAQDPAYAGKLYRRSCDGGCLLGCNKLGVCYEDGACGLDKDPAAAVGLYEKACKGGEPAGCVNLAECHEKGECGLARDPARAQALYKKACDAGDQHACSKLNR